MLIAATMSSSSPLRSDNDSPNRQIRGEDGRYRRYETRNGSRPRSQELDSPTRQLVNEFTRFYIYSERERQRRLNEADAAQKREHDDAIECARVKHEEVRIAAEKATETFYLELDRQRREKLEAEAKALEKARRAKEELEARQKTEELENARRREEHARKLEAQSKELAEIEARTKFLQEQTAAKKKELEENALRAAREKQRQQQEAAQQQLQQQQQQQKPQGGKDRISASQIPQQPQTQPKPAPPASPSAPASSFMQSPVIISTDARTAEHNKYLELHQRLKKMRKHMNDACKNAKKTNPNSPLAQLQEMRRTIMKSIGQLTADKQHNAKIVR
jgi:nucleoporin GLE1